MRGEGDEPDNKLKCNKTHKLKIIDVSYDSSYPQRNKRGHCILAISIIKKLAC